MCGLCNSLLTLVFAGMTVLAVGGYIQGPTNYWLATNASEVLSKSSTCTSYVPPSLPKLRVGHVSLVTPSASLICGGYTQNSEGEKGQVSRSCLAFNATNHTWTYHSTITSKRSGGASGVVLDSGAYILGGVIRNTSDFLPAGSTTWQEGPQIPGEGAKMSCVVALNSSSFLLIGGADRTQVRQYNEVTRVWSEWPRTQERMDQHSCLRYNNTIIVAGSKYGY